MTKAQIQADESPSSSKPQIGLTTTLMISTMASIIFAVYQSYGYAAMIAVSTTLGFGSFAIATLFREEYQFPLIINGLCCLIILIVTAAIVSSIPNSKSLPPEQRNVRSQQ